jgi:gliding motility-associated-like protein
VNYGSTTTISASPSGGTAPYSYLWNPTNDVSQVISVAPTVTTIYCVTVTDANKCSDSACVTVNVEFNCGDGPFLPNAFSPDNDGKNDYFLPRNVCFKSFLLVIYDMWGRDIFKTEDLTTKGWDGKYANGTLAETGSYVYRLTYELVNGDKGTKNGTVTLVR